MEPVPPIRLSRINEAPVDPHGDYVLYWMIAFRRSGWNFALQHAVAEAERLAKPLVILEALRCDYPWASDRLHRFILDGMADNARRLKSRPALYHPYVEGEKGGGRGLLAALAQKACLVVTDDFPAFFLPRMVAAAGKKLGARLTAVDSNGLLPLRAAEQDYPSAYAFRRFLQKNLPGHLGEPPHPDPLKECALPTLASLPQTITGPWPAAFDLIATKGAEPLAALPIDHRVAIAPITGGTTAARQRLTRFVNERLADYAELRNQPEREVTSELSAYLHFGHISAHEIFARIADEENWTLGDLGPDTRGKREGWWGMTRAAEAFLDQVVTWRELGYNFCAFRDDGDRYRSLPEWVRKTLEAHADDPRPYLYTLEEFERAATHDRLWNAAQRQLLREGKIHNYLRMLWGKKILEWSRNAREALAVMIELNNKYALDGRDPNSDSGIFWCLGRYDRPWQERPIFGKIRYMSSENTGRKFPLAGYLEKYQEKG